MTDHCDKLTLEEETIQAMEQRAQRLHLCTRVLSWTVLPCLFGTAFAVVTAVGHPHVGAASLFRIVMLSTLPLLSAGVWIAVEEVRTRSALRRFRDVFPTGRSDSLTCVPSSAIGPLLEMLMPGARNASVLPVQVALLSGLLKSVRAEEEVMLTEGQRNILHDFVIVGSRHWFNLHDDRLLGEEERDFVRPTAIRALAVLGNRTSISVLERFAKKTGDPELRQAAFRSVDQIQERLQCIPSEMLRAGDAPERPDTLLRAAIADRPQSSDPQQLLRADNADVDGQT